MPDFNSDFNTSVINSDGLRYASKSAGSQFDHSIGRSMSCIKCGKHRQRSLLRPFKLAGAQHYCCAPNCAELAEKLQD